MNRFRSWLWGLTVLWCTVSAVRADDSRPAYLEVREIGPGHYEVMWKTPMLGRARLRMAPNFGSDFQNIEGTYRRQIVSDALIERWEIRSQSGDGLHGREVGVEGLALTLRDVVVRMRFRSGQTVSAVLRAARSTFVVPEPGDVGPGSTAGVLRAAVFAGFWHGVSGLAHLVFAAAIGLALGARAMGVSLGAFTALHIMGVLLGSVTGLSIPLPWAEGLLGAAAALAARDAVLGGGRRLSVICGLAGLAHGVALAGAGDQGTAALLATSLGIDTAQLAVGAIALLVAVLARPLVGARRVVPYACGTLALAIALVAVARPPAASAAPATAASGLPAGLTTVPAAAPGSAAGTRSQGLSAPVQVYLDVAPFETRLEVLARLPALDRWFGLGLAGRAALVVEDQGRVLDRVVSELARRLQVEIDGEVEAVLALRRGFAVTGDVANGTYLREAPVPEDCAAAVVGIVFAFPTPGVPRGVTVSWRDLPAAETVPAVMIDPESSRDAALSESSSVLRWRNELREDPLPTVDAVAVRSPVWELSPLSLILAAVALAFGGYGLRNSRRGLVGARLALAGACVVAPVWTVVVPAPWGGAAAPESREAAAICGSLLQNVYRAFDYRGEEAIYDRLAVSVSGEQLARVYLEHRRGLEVEKTGGARARVEAVEVTGVTDVRSAPGGGFAADVAWTVAGSVTHFGHRHLRQNRYRAAVTVTPAAGAWKLQQLELREEERLR